MGSRRSSRQPINATKAMAPGAKEKKYYHVQISKLAEAFENQFFTSIQQCQAFESHGQNHQSLRSQSLE